MPSRTRARSAGHGWRWRPRPPAIPSPPPSTRLPRARSLPSRALAAITWPLVMTSGNVSDEPIAFEDGDARDRLAGIADLFVAHDRSIQTRTDDSVVRVVSARTTVLRRSRGYVPGSLSLPGDGAVRPL